MQKKEYFKTAAGMRNSAQAPECVRTPENGAVLVENKIDIRSSVPCAWALLRFKGEKK